MEKAQVENSWPKSRPRKAKVYRERKNLGWPQKLCHKNLWKSTSKLGCLRPVARSKIMPVPSYSGRDDILELIEDPDSIAAEAEESEDYRQDVHEILIRIENLFTSKVEKSATSENIESGSTQQIVHIPLENASRLPKLTLPHFSGDAVDWINFWDCFSARS